MMTAPFKIAYPALRSYVQREGKTEPITHPSMTPDLPMTVATNFFFSSGLSCRLIR